MIYLILFYRDYGLSKTEKYSYNLYILLYFKNKNIYIDSYYLKLNVLFNE